MFAGRVVITQNQFEAIAKNAIPGVAGVMRTGMQNFILVADRLTPVDKGLLKANKTIVVPSKSFGSNPKGRITWNQEYGIYQEFGTVFTPGVHFATRAAAMISPGYVASFRGVIERGGFNW